MKLAVSNIAWPREQDAAVAEVLVEHGVTGIEVAPTKVRPNPLEATDDEIAAYRRFWNDRGIEIVAAQALLFGRPDLTLFESAETRVRTLEYLTGIVRFCARLGAGSFVFGSPKNRRVGGLPAASARGVAAEFFGRLGEAAHRAGAAVVMEANPPEYGADFVTRAAEAVELVRAVSHPGFRLLLDTGCMTLAGDAIPATLAEGLPLLRHFHVSEPNLDPPGTSGRVDHRAFAEELANRGYSGWVSLEVRESKPFVLDEFTSSIRWLKERYAPASALKAAG